MFRAGNRETRAPQDNETIVPPGKMPRYAAYTPRLTCEKLLPFGDLETLFVQFRARKLRTALVLRASEIAPESRVQTELQKTD